MSDIISQSMSDGYGIIPRSIMRSGNLNVYEKCILAYFLSFTGAGKNVCWPSLETISKELGISKNTTIKNLKTLENKKFIGKSKLDDKNKTSVNKYTLFFNATTGERFNIKVYEPSSASNEQPSASGDIASASDEPALVHEVNTNINSINNNNNINININKKAAYGNDVITNIIDLYNRTFNKECKYVESNMKPIRARLKDGFKLDDFKKVVDNKLNDPFFKANPQHYAISTLFGNKFDKYLNETPKKKKSFSTGEFKIHESLGGK